MRDCLLLVPKIISIYINKMTEFPINWRLTHSNAFHPQKSRYISNLKKNADWSLICIWDSRHRVPEVIEICRNSTIRDIFVSGAFEVVNQNYKTTKKKFMQFIEAGLTTTQVELGNFTSRPSYYMDFFSIVGTLKFSAAVTHEKNTKMVHCESLMELSRDFERLLDPKSNYFSDVNLECGAISFPVHKNILSVRSPVFAAMFATEMKENRENVVDISDISPQVLKTLLTYIYTGKTGELSVQSAGELLFAADKYQLQDLKRVCSGYLKNRVSVENVLNTFVLGYLHDDGLKDFALDFICNSCEEFEVLEKTTEWKNLREKRPSLAMDVLTRVVKAKDERLKRYK